MIADALVLDESLNAAAKAIDTGHSTFAESLHELLPTFAGQLSAEAVAAAGRARSVDVVNDADSISQTWWMLLFALIDAAEPEARDSLIVAGTLPFLYAVNSYCISVPDGRLFSIAIGRAKAAIEAAERRSAYFDASELLHRLGVLHLDPFVGGRTAAFEIEDQIWRQKLEAKLGKTVAALPGAAMPDTPAALELAQHYFDIALEFRLGRPRGFTLKALCGCLMWRERWGTDAQHAQIAAYAAEALPLLPEDYGPELSAFVDHFGGGDRGTLASVDAAMLAEDPVEQFALLEPKIAADRYRIWANNAHRRNPTAVLTLIMRVWPLLQGGAFVAECYSFAEIFGKVGAAAVEQEGLELRSDDRLVDVSASINAHANADTWTDLYRFAVHCGLAMACVPHDRESEGADYLIGLLAEVPLSLPDAAHEIARLLQAALLQNAGSNAYAVGDSLEATNQYSRAAIAYAVEKQLDRSLHALNQAEDAARGSVDAANFFVRFLAMVTPEIAKLGNRALAEVLRAMWARVVSVALAIGETGHSIDLETAVVALQAAKGLNFAARVARRQPGHLQDDVETQALLEEILALRTYVSPDYGESREINKNVLLVSYDSNVGEDVPGEVGKLLRLQQQFDTIVSRADGEESTFGDNLLGYDELTALIGADTVLISQFVGETKDGQLAIITLLLTDSEIGFAAGIMDLPYGQIQLGGVGAAVKASWLTPVVAGVRDGIDSDPEAGAPVSSAAVLQLAQLYQQLMGGGIAERLAAWRDSGKTHICFHPYDALHFLPMQLIGGEEGVLGDQWTVTTVPHVAVLRRNWIAPTSYLLPVIAFGMDYPDGQPHNRLPLDCAEGEAQAVARVMSGVAILGSDVTEAKFREGLVSAARVHLACHGEMELVD